MMRVGLHELFELHQLELLARDVLALGLADPLHLQAEGHVSQRRAHGNSWAKSWNTMPRSMPWPVMALPPMRISPAVGARSRR